MIYTVTFNPAIDYVIRLNNLKIGEINRSSSNEYFIGGKGINVSCVLKELGMDSIALGFAAGFTGSAILNQLKAKGIREEFIRLSNGISRINVKIRSSSETDLNGGGPEISDCAVQELIKRLKNASAGDIVVLSGSVPNGTPAEIYAEIIKEFSGSGVRFAVDAAGPLLKETLQYNPFLIKPNHIELGELFGVKIQTADEILRYAKKTQDMGAVNVLVSVGEKGCVLLDENGAIHTMKPVKGDCVNSTGAGDSMVAGFLAGYMLKKDFDYALKLGTAAGAATAFSSSLATGSEILHLLEKL